MSLKNVALIVGALFASTACSAFDFEVKQQSEEVVLQGDLEAFKAFIPVPGDLIPDQVIDVSMSDDPAGIYLFDAEIELTDTVMTAHQMQIPFSFINSLELWVFPTQEGSTLPPRRLAQTGPAPEGPVIPMMVDDGVNLLPYLKEGLVLKNLLDARVPAADLSFRTHFTLGVDVF